MANYKKYIFICTNKRDPTKKACGNQWGNQLVEHGKLVAKSIQKTANVVRIANSGCLGRCEEGPLCVTYPQGSWYRINSREDIARVVVGELTGGGQGDKLFIPSKNND